MSLLLNCEAGIDELRNKKLSIELKQYREKRSLTANATAWVLINQLADKLNLKPVEVYREYIKDINVCKQMILPKNEFNTLKTAWEMLGLGWVVEELDITDKDEIIANFYYGSSTYNVNQMYKFIKNIVEDCKLQGIPTPEQRKIDKMIGEWNK